VGPGGQRPDQHEDHDNESNTVPSISSSFRAPSPVDGRCTPPALPERLPEQALKPGRRAALEALRVVKTSRPAQGRSPSSISVLSFPLPR
jgi:hypothetical protein